MIKIGSRPNLFYPSIFIIFNAMRKMDSIIMKKYINYSGCTLLTFLMFFSNFISGLLVYSRQYKFLKEKEKEASKFMGIELIQTKTEISPIDSDIKIYFFLFFETYIDFAENILSSYYIPDKFTRISKSLEWRLKSIIICASGVFGFFILKIPIFKHQILSMIIILACLLITLITEIIEYYEENSQDDRLFYIIYVLFLLLINQTFTSGFDIIEKYLLDFDFVNPFKLLMMKGMIGFFIILLFCIYQDPFEQIKIINDNTPEKIPYLIVSLILYFLFSCGRNIYRIITIKLYSPTHKALFDYIFVPLLIIYYFIFDNDFTVNNNKVYYYFMINLIISFIIVICGLIYNEFLVLFFCNLQYNTHYEISKRAKKIQSKAFDLSINESLNESNFNDSNIYNKDD